MYERERERERVCLASCEEGEVMVICTYDALESGRIALCADPVMKDTPEMESP